MLNILLQTPMIPGEAAAAGAIEATPDRAYRKASEARPNNTPPGCDSSPETLQSVYPVSTHRIDDRSQPKRGNEAAGGSATLLQRVLNAFDKAQESVGVAAGRDRQRFLSGRSLLPPRKQ